MHHRFSPFAAPLAALALVALAAPGWAIPFVRLTNLTLTPSPEKCAPGDEVRVTGQVEYRYLLGYITEVHITGGTRVIHNLHVDLDTLSKPGDQWPVLPTLRSARGKLYVGYNGPLQEYKQPALQGYTTATRWGYRIGSPVRSKPEEPAEKTETRSFDFTFKMPECSKFRIRATLEHSYGWNWFVTWYYYDWREFPGPLSKGMKAITVRCQRKGYFPTSALVLAPATVSEVTVSGTVTDRRLAVPVPGAKVSADGVSAVTGRDGAYSIKVAVGGQAAPAQASANFAVDGTSYPVAITLRARKTGFQDGKERKIFARVRSGTVVVCGAVSELRGTTWWPAIGAEVEATGPGGTRRCTTGRGGWYHLEWVLDGSRPGTYKRVVELRLGPSLKPQPKAEPLPGGVQPGQGPDAFTKEIEKRLSGAPPAGRWLMDKWAWYNALKNDLKHRLMGGKGWPNLDRYYKRRKTAVGQIRNGIQVIQDEGSGTIPQQDIIQKTDDVYKKLTGNKKKPPAQRKDLISIIQKHYNDVEKAGQ